VRTLPGPPQERAAYTVPPYVRNPTSTAAPACRARASWPRLISPPSRISVARASPTCVLCAHTTTGAAAEVLPHASRLSSISESRTFHELAHRGRHRK
jgi:hypothetical protein